MAGQMAANLATNVKEALEGYPRVLGYCWSDSTVALHWIRGNGEYRQFVNNRVQKMRKKEWVKWRYVPTKENPADLGSRRGHVNQENSLWWYGPEWLSNPGAWPADVATTATPESLNEAKTIKEVFKLASKEEENVLDIGDKPMASTANYRLDCQILAQH